MTIGLGHLGMRPADFWALTLPEWLAAMDGYCEKHGIGKGGSDARPPSQAEIDDLVAVLKSKGRLPEAA